MAVPRYPCRSCGQATEAEDTYVVCPECLAQFEPWQGGQVADEDRHPPDSAPAPWQTPLAPDEIEARLRRLLDDW